MDSNTGEPEVKKAKLENEEIGSTPSESSEKKRSPELEKLWKTVEDDPTDFTGWTYLLQHVDSSANVDQAREAFDAFLYRYPYCYGYWKKYSDLEKRKGTKEKCLLVFERGVKAIALSVDLWLHYINYLRAEYEDNTDFIRNQYERALATCGREWRSDKLWDNYVKWETNQQKDFVRVIKLYDRILRNPTQGIAHQFEMFRDFVKEHKPEEMLETDEFQSLRKDVLAQLRKKRGEEQSGDVAEESRELTEEENTAICENIISKRKKVFRQTEETCKDRLKYEDNIKRPYFHMKPLERGQLNNWKEYLDHEIKEQGKDGGDESLVEVIFERCLIACALYEEFWSKYADWTKSTRKDLTEAKRIEKIRDIYDRACNHHLPKKVDIHLSFASFEEENGEFERATKVLRNLEEKHPEMLSIMVRRINLERRRGNIEEVNNSYLACIAKAKKGVKSELALKYARFLRLNQDDKETAEKVIRDALAEDESNPKLYLQLLDICLYELPMNMSKVLQVFDEAIKKCSSPKVQLLFSQRRVEFLEDFGTNVKDLISFQDAHDKLSKEIKANSKTDTEETSSDAQSGEEGGLSIKTIEGRPSSKKASSGNAAGAYAYGAHHPGQYDQYGSQYSGQYGGYYGGYPGHQGYQGYGSYPSY